MNYIRQHTRFVLPSERASLWAEINRAHFGDLQVDAMDDGLEEAELTAFRLEDLRVFRIDVPAHKISRSHRHVDDGLNDSYKLLLQLRGRGRIQQRTRRPSAPARPCWPPPRRRPARASQ